MTIWLVMRPEDNVVINVVDDQGDPDTNVMQYTPGQYLIDKAEIEPFYPDIWNNWQYTPDDPDHRTENLPGTWTDLNMRP